MTAGPLLRRSRSRRFYPHCYRLGALARLITEELRGANHRLRVHGQTTRPSRGQSVMVDGNLPRAVGHQHDAAQDPRGDPGRVVSRTDLLCRAAR